MRSSKLTPLLVIAIFTLFSCNKDERSSSTSEINVEERQAAGRKSSYPSYNTNPLPPDATGMTSTAVQIAANIRLGWNLGNTLEAIGGETAWGNPQTTQALIDKVKTSGINAVRIHFSVDRYGYRSTARIKSQR